MPKVAQTSGHKAQVIHVEHSPRGLILTIGDKRSYGLRAEDARSLAYGILAELERGRDRVLAQLATKQKK